MENLSIKRLKMTISEETRLLNFIISVLKRNDLLVRAIIEYDVEIPAIGNSKPDLFSYLLREPDFDNYQLIEMKQRTTLNENDVNIIRAQYNRYTQIRYNNLDSTKIPVIDHASILINYVFFNTPQNILETINREVNFDQECGILFYFTKGEDSREISFFKEPNSPKHYQLDDLFVQNSKNREFWRNLLIPFTKEDLSGINGLGGSPFNVRINPEVSFSIILSHLFTFVLQRKIRGESSEFHTDSFFEHIFSNLSPLVHFNNDEKINMIRKLTLFLNKVSDVCSEGDFVFIEKNSRANHRFFIRLRRTETFFRRIPVIQNLIFRKLDNEIRQRRLDEFTDN